MDVLAPIVHVLYLFGAIRMSTTNTSLALSNSQGEVRSLSLPTWGQTRICPRSLGFWEHNCRRYRKLLQEILLVGLIIAASLPQTNERQICRNGG